MIETKISDVTAEEILSAGTEIEPVFFDTDMTREERLFVSGCINRFGCSRLLEVGVAGGGGSANILNTIMDKDAMLTSIDITDVFHHDPLNQDLIVGGYVGEQFPNLPSGKWRLLTGKDPSIRMEEMDERFDFMILDTGHLHPFESLNFLSTFPYLEENAIVILHDITLFMDSLIRKGMARCQATRILMVALCADRIVPEINGFGGYPNIVALQMTNETKKYIRNVFDGLLIPWEYYPHHMLGCVGGLIKKQYEEELYQIFLEAVKINKRITVITSQYPGGIGKILSQNKPLYYGAGNNMRGVLEYYKKCNVPFDNTIWDKNAEQIGEIEGHIVSLPNRNSKVEGDPIMIITIEDETEYGNLQREFSNLGYSVYHGLVEWLESII